MHCLAFGSHLLGVWQVEQSKPRRNEGTQNPLAGPPWHLPGLLICNFLAQLLCKGEGWGQVDRRRVTWPGHWVAGPGGENSEQS